VCLLFNAFVSTAVYRPTFETFLPIESEGLAADSEESSGRLIDYLFEPDRASVLEQLMPSYLRARFFITLAEALTSEHSARMLAMNNATQNCEELGDLITLQMNKARQSGITKDLLDIVGGAEALTKGRV